MTDKILIDRDLLEQALGALFMYKPMVTGVTFQHGLDAMQALRAALEQQQVEQEPTPNGATHRQPKQGAFYKRVDGKWYVWSRMETGEPHRWYISPGTTESCLEPLYIHPQPPRQPLTDQQIHDCFQHRHRDKATERRMITRAIEFAHGITGDQE